MFALVRKNCIKKNLINKVRAIAKTEKTRFSKGDRFEKVLRIVLLLSLRFFFSLLLFAAVHSADE